MLERRGQFKQLLSVAFTTGFSEFFSSSAASCCVLAGGWGVTTLGSHHRGVVSRDVTRAEINSYRSQSEVEKSLLCCSAVQF